MNVFSRKAVTLLELIIVLIIVAIAVGLAYPNVQKGIENQEAKKALETMRTISQAVRLYEVDHGDLLDDNTPARPIQLANLEAAGYVKPTEYAYASKFTYSINSAATPPVLTAVNQSSGRTITLAQDAVNKAQDGLVNDSEGFLALH